MHSVVLKNSMYCRCRQLIAAESVTSQVALAFGVAAQVQLSWLVAFSFSELLDCLQQRSQLHHRVFPSMSL